MLLFVYVLCPGFYIFSSALWDTIDNSCLCFSFIRSLMMTPGYHPHSLCTWWIPNQLNFLETEDFQQSACFSNLPKKSNFIDNLKQKVELSMGHYWALTFRTTCVCPSYYATKNELDALPMLDIVRYDIVELIFKMVATSEII